MSKTSSIHADGASKVRKAPRERLLGGGSPGISPRPRLGLPPHFPDLLGGTENARRRVISAHPPPPSGGRGGRGGRDARGRERTASGPPIAVREWRGGERRGLLTRLPHPAASARSPIPRVLTARGSPPGLGEPISPSEGPPNLHLISARADGEPRGTGSPRFPNRGNRGCRPRRAAENRWDRRRGVPSVVYNDQGCEKPPIEVNGQGPGEGVGLQLGYLRPNFKQLINGNGNKL